MTSESHPAACSPRTGSCHEPTDRSALLRLDDLRLRLLEMRFRIDDDALDDRGQDEGERAGHDNIGLAGQRSVVAAEGRDVAARTDRASNERDQGKHDEHTSNRTVAWWKAERYGHHQSNQEQVKIAAQDDEAIDEARHEESDYPSCREQMPSRVVEPRRNRICSSHHQ